MGFHIACPYTCTNPLLLMTYTPVEPFQAMALQWTTQYCHPNLPVCISVHCKSCCSLGFDKEMMPGIHQDYILFWRSWMGIRFSQSLPCIINLLLYCSFFNLSPHGFINWFESVNLLSLYTLRISSTWLWFILIDWLCVCVCAHLWGPEGRVSTFLYHFSSYLLESGSLTEPQFHLS